ncbi:MAG: cation-translocating P-type ATPase [Methanobacteriaceae archaeon]|nr:cation-translocating P-type ATPase [Methanobacteriaceae archaeon]
MYQNTNTQQRLETLNETLAGLKMTIVSGIFLAISLTFIILKIQLPLDPAWGAVIISGIPLLYLAITRLIYEKWISSALLIVIAMIASLFIGQIFAAGEVVFIMALGALLEDYTVDRAKNGLKKLINLTPQKGRKVITTSNSTYETIVDVKEIKLNDTLRVLPGEVIPVDGKIIQGNTSIDQSIMTGESLPVDKEIGDEVFCGTMNLYGSIDMEATSIGEDSSLQKLIDMVKEAENKQAPTQRIADKWATWLVPVALAIAIAAYLFTGDLIRGVTVLVVFCPCALILATPTSIMAAIGQATKYGVMIKSGEALENLGKTNTLAFDKTGTLTYGNLEVSDIIPTKENLTSEDLIKKAAISEKRSEHPLAKAIIKYTNQNNLKIEEPENFTMIPGKGVKSLINNEEIYCGNINFLKENNIEIDEKINSTLNNLTNQGKANIIVADKNQTLGIIALSDILREDAKEMIQNLKELDTNVILLTGDNLQAANYFSNQVGITDVHAGLLPEDKVKEIQKIKDNNEMVAMIGDGVNDAPALKTANISVAMAKVGSDVAIDAADVALLGDDIQKIPYLKKLSNATLTNIHFNIALSMCINAVAIVCSVMGLLNPVTGALVHNIGSCIVVANAGLLYDRKFDDNIKKYDSNEVNKQKDIQTLTHSHENGGHNHSHKDLHLGDVVSFDGEKHTHHHF